MNTAVLFLIFNRPDTTRVVFEAIRQARPPRLYVAADGPRTGRDGERKRCEEVRRITTTVDWPCEVKKLFRDENLGVMYSCVNAINWFFDNEEEGIVLEDDVLPALDFFSYCETLLEHYRDKQEIMMISGCNPVSGRYESPYSYDFSNYAIVWGWASWRRAWKHYDVDIKKWPSFKKDRQLLRVPKVTKTFEAIWTEIYDKQFNKQIVSWDYQWFFAINSHHSYMIIPNTNLVNNIGYGEDATHTIEAMPTWVRDLKAGGMSKKIIHPTRIDNNEEIDRLFEVVVFGTNRFTYIKFVIKKMLGPIIVSRIIYIKSVIKKMMAAIKIYK